MPIYLAKIRKITQPHLTNLMAKKLVISAIAFLTLGALDRLPANLIIAIDQTGANQPVSVDTPRAWNFGITSVGAAYFSANGITFDSALFDAKIHNDTTAPLVFTLYSGLGGNVKGNTVLATVSMPASSFNQQYTGGVGSLFTFNPQLFTTGYYSVALTTAAPDTSTQDYFLKQGTLELLNSDKTVLNSSFWLQDQGTGNATTVFNGTGSLGGYALAPEPNAAWAAALVTGLSFGGSLLNRFQKKRSPSA